MKTTKIMRYEIITNLQLILKIVNSYNSKKILSKKNI